MIVSTNPPSVEDHRSLARENLAFADGLRASAQDPVAIRWAVTALFYAALHALSAYMLHRYDVVALEHKHRWPWLRTYSELKRFAYDYRELYERSHAARYSPATFTGSDYDKLRARGRHMIERWLKDSG